MAMTVEKIVAIHAEEHAKFVAALRQETDRGCALFAAAYIDNALKHLLSASLVDFHTKEADLFEHNGPLGTFSGRTKIAFYIGKISASCRRDIDTIRKIRNDFAHSADPLTFENEAISQRCRNLRYSFQATDSRPRAHYTAAVSGLMAFLDAERLRATAIAEKADDSPSEQLKANTRERVEELKDDLIAALHRISEDQKERRDPTSSESENSNAGSPNS